MAEQHNDHVLAYRLYIALMVRVDTQRWHDTAELRNRLRQRIVQHRLETW
jgi:hypothetical protein